jgi:para-aminobenzoate synthetase component I
MPITMQAGADHFSHRMNQLGRRRIPFLFIIDYAMQQPVILPLAEVDSRQIRYQVNEWGNGAEPHRAPAGKIQFDKYPVDFPAYQRAFRTVMAHLLAGNTFLVNLTFPTEIRTSLSLDDIYFRSQARYKLWFRDQFVVFSPETFIQMRGGYVYTHPMKGTIDASLPQAAEKLLADPKELAEHVTIVDLLRNDLSVFASGVQVKRFRYLSRIRTHQGSDILQMSSEICGKLPADYHSRLGDILFSMLPAGSICGAPKPRTLEIIREAETYDRGYYTGVMGVFDGENLDSGVMIRFIEQSGGRLYFKSGGGITARSNALTEYQELLNKVYVPFT